MIKYFLILFFAFPLYAELPNGATDIQQGADSSTIGKWDLNAGTGLTAYEVSGNGNNGTITGAAWTDSPWGKCLLFAGGTDGVNCGDLTTGALAKFSVTLWFKTTHDFTSSDFLFTSVSDKDIEIYVTAADEIQYYVGRADGNSILCSLAIINDGKWHFLAGVSDNSVGDILYIDGVFQESASFVGAYDVWNKNTEIGYSNRGFTGNIDRVKLYDEALTQARIVNIMTAQSEVRQ